MLTCTLSVRNQAIIYQRDLGWAVFPVAANKNPLTWNGFMDASKEHTRVQGWWNIHPEANLGVATGKVSGVVVLDVDPKNGGDIEAFEERVGFGLPPTWTVHTGGGGTHYYFKSPKDDFGGLVVVRNAQGYQGVAGIDVRGDGGYVIAPPSVHASGDTYMWDAESLTRPIAVWPKFPLWRPAYAGVGDDDKFPQGARNANLTRLAGAMRRYGASADDILATLRNTNRNRCVPILDDDEVEKIARRVYNTYGPQFQQPTYSAGRGEGSDSGGSSDSGGRPDEDGISETRTLRGAGQPRYIRSGAWYLGRGRKT